MDEDRELNMDFKRMTIADVEALVRRKCDSVEIKNKWIHLTFNLPTPELSPIPATTHIRIRRW